MATSFFMLMYRHFSGVTRVTDVVEARGDYPVAAPPHGPGPGEYRARSTRAPETPKLIYLLNGCRRCLVTSTSPDTCLLPWKP